MKKISEAIFSAIMVAFSIGVVVVVGAEPKMIETDWVPRLYNAKSSVASSTHSVTGIGIAYTVVAKGADVTFSVHGTTKTLNGVVWKSSDTVSITDGIIFNDQFNPLTQDPSIVIHGLTTTATAYVYIRYGETRRD